jgi:hypothetical protein
MMTWRMAIVCGLLLTLAGCQSSGPATPPPVAGGDGASVLATGDKPSICKNAAMRQFAVTAENVSLSNEYPHNDGDAIDGAATLAVDFQRFRCEFSRDGAMTGIVNIDPDS